MSKRTLWALADDDHQVILSTSKEHLELVMTLNEFERQPSYSYRHLRNIEKMLEKTSSRSELACAYGFCELMGFDHTDWARSAKPRMFKLSVNLEELDIIEEELPDEQPST